MQNIKKINKQRYKKLTITLTEFTTVFLYSLGMHREENVM